MTTDITNRLESLSGRLRTSAELGQYEHTVLEARIEIDTLRAEVADLRDTLQFVERWANHHGRKPCVSAENALSTIQHHPAIKAITRSYADGVVPETRDPWAELEAAIAERDALRDLLALVTAVGVTMLHHTHRDDVRKEFSEDELLRVVAISEPASEAGRSVESIYRQGFDAAIATQSKEPS